MLRWGLLGGLLGAVLLAPGASGAPDWAGAVQRRFLIDCLETGASEDGCRCLMGALQTVLGPARFLDLADGGPVRLALGGEAAAARALRLALGRCAGEPVLEALAPE